jgi:hypothetical protein
MAMMHPDVVRRSQPFEYIAPKSVRAIEKPIKTRRCVKICLFEGPQSGLCAGLFHFSCPAIFTTQGLHYQSVTD